jgi:hypothetical protein
MLVSVDPGVKEAGVAVFEDQELVAAWLERGEDWLETAQNVYRQIDLRYPSEVARGIAWVIEIPQVYTQNKLKGDPNDLIQLALVAGALGSLTHTDDLRNRFITYLPRQWKGQTPKKTMNKRVQGRLSREELERVELPRAESLQHNVWDAIGIGMYQIRRRK